MLIIKNLDSSFLSNVVKTDNAIRDSLALKNSNPTNFSGVITVSTAACFSINTFNVNNSERVAWDDTSLVKMETVLFFCISFVHKVLVNVNTIVNDSVGFIFDGLFFFLTKRLIVSDVQMSLINSFLSTILPDMRSENLSARSKDDVSTSVMSSQLISSFSVNSDSDFFPFK
jgi:hypothetical protein